ncbi:hypothetical protein [Clostridium sp.]|uniref:hypothetical protein n=1 Tax=Clostridium sp. TaxID=1506 RepID=UPI00261C5465|nr:hypothetical protein [Clostridium sp.]
MNEIELNLRERVTSLTLYEDFIYKLNKWYRSGNGLENPIIDLSEVEWIDALAIPNILVIGNIMRSFHGKPIRLILPSDLRLVNFMRTSNFFLVSNLGNINLFDYDVDLVERAAYFIDNENRDKHKIHYYKPELSYYLIEKEEEQLKYRASMYESIRYIVAPNQYKDVLMDQDVLSERELNVLLDIISEIICNSILYSKSISYSFIQTDKYKSNFSISDSGIGFKKSLLNKNNVKTYLFDLYKNILDYNQFEDFIVIMDVLFYSMNQNRRNLWSLKEIIVSSGGTLRIHNNSTQVVFTSKKCAGCYKGADECFKCLLDAYKKGHSNLRIFKAKLRGVHIEVELKNNERMGNF